MLVERRTYSHKWSVSFVKIIVIANGTVEVGADGEIGIGMGTEEMIFTATTEDGDCDGAPDQQQQGGRTVRLSRHNPLGECLWSTR